MPGTVSAKPTRNPKKKPVEKITEDLSGNSKNSVHSLRDVTAKSGIPKENTVTGKSEAGENSFDGPASQVADEGNKIAQRKSGI